MNQKNAYTLDSWTTATDSKTIPPPQVTSVKCVLGPASSSLMDNVPCKYIWSVAPKWWSVLKIQKNLGNLCLSSPFCMQKVGCDESWVNWPQSLICKEFLWINKERMMNWLPKIIHRKQNFKNVYAIIECSSSLAIKEEHYIVKFCIVRAEV